MANYYCDWCWLCEMWDDRDGCCSKWGPDVTPAGGCWNWLAADPEPDSDYDDEDEEDF